MIHILMIITLTFFVSFPAVADRYLVYTDSGGDKGQTGSVAEIGRAITHFGGNVRRGNLFRYVSGSMAELSPEAAEAIRAQGYWVVPAGMSFYLSERMASVRKTESVPVSWNLDRTDNRFWLTDGGYNPTGRGTGGTVYIIDTNALPNADFGGRATLAFDAVGDGRANDPSPFCHGHGTFMASMVVSGTFGFAPEARAVMYRAFECDGASGNPQTIIKAIEKLLDYSKAHPSMPVGVVNMSFGAPPLSNGSVFDPWLKKLAATGKFVLVAAGGNDGALVNDPANSPYVLAVGALNVDAGVPTWSSQGGKIALFAPGQDVPGFADATDQIWYAFGSSVSAAETSALAIILARKYPLLPAAVIQRLVAANATRGRIVSGLKTGTPNRLIYFGPAVESLAKPPKVKHTAGKGGGSITANVFLKLDNGLPLFQNATLYAKPDCTGKSITALVTAASGEVQTTLLRVPYTTQVCLKTQLGTKFVLGVER